MKSKTIVFERDNGIARIRLNRPDRLNAFVTQMHEEMAAALDVLEADNDLRVLCITGEGRGFCAGQDLLEYSPEAGGGPRDLGDALEYKWNPMARRLARLRAPVVAAVNGIAAGAGASLAFACDIVIACNSAKFIQSFAQIGLIPDMGGTWTMPRLAGQARAMGMALTTEPVPAVTAAEWGLIWRAVEDGSFDAEVNALVDRLAGLSPSSLAGIKHAIRTSGNATFDDQLDLERDLQRDLGWKDDYAEGVRAFSEKRQPRFTGR